MTLVDPFEAPLREGTLVRRYKRFLADIRLDDTTQVTAHCPNSGSMLGLSEPGFRCMVRHVDEPRRKLQWSWELVSPDETTWVGINTMRPNQVVARLVEDGRIPELPKPERLRREVPYGNNSRIDLLLEQDDRRTYVEIKNTTLEGSAAGGDAGSALFPDAVTARGAKHMHELANQVAAGDEALVLFFVNRSDCHRFAVARELDPAYAEAFDHARDAGVAMLPIGMDVGPEGWRMRGTLPMAGP